MYSKTSSIGVNNIVSKIILGFLFISFFFILSFYTFFHGEKNELDAVEFNISQIGEKAFSGGIEDRINLYTTIYSENKDYKIEKDTISIGDGIYFIDSRDPFSELIIKMGTNNILMKGGGMIYINNDSKYKKIVSFNNKLEINFINTDENKKGIKMYLYPHMYFSFSPSRLTQSEKADSLLVSKYGNLNYFNYSFLDLIELEKISFIKNENLEFFKKSLNILLEKQKKYSLRLEKIKNNKFSNILSINYIENYFIFLYNDRKKTIYYKNKILKGIINILNKKNNNIFIISSDMNSLKDINIKEYNKLLNLSREIYFLTLYDFGDDSNIVQNNYNKLMSEIFSFKSYKNIDLIKEVDMYNYLGNFTDFLNLLIGSIDNIDLLPLEKEYYILLKQNILVSNFANFDIEQKYLDILLKGFISYSENIEKNIKIKEKKQFIKNVNNNVDLLDNLSLVLKNRYFEKRNDPNKLLIVKKNKIININDLEKSINDLFDKYDKSFKYLGDSKYDILKLKYGELNKELDEYILALKSYSLYKSKYSKVNKALLEVDIYKDKEDSLSKNKFLDYIKYFSGINILSIDVDVMEDYYNIKNISINNSNFSFELYPYSGNLLKNIKKKNINQKIDNEGFYSFIESTSYSLDTEKEKYENSFNKSRNEEKEKYNFRKFFQNTFFPKGLSNNKADEYIYDSKDDLEGDDDIIQTFKRAKLLGNRGEFRKISDFLNIKYSNLDIKRKFGNIFLININNSLINLSIEEKGRIINYSSLFNSRYELNKDEHYFYNIELTPFEKGGSNNKKELFPNIKFNILGEIELLKIEDKIKEVFLKIEKIKQDYLKIKNKGKIVSIDYDIVTGKYSFVTE